MVRRVLHIALVMALTLGAGTSYADLWTRPIFGSHRSRTSRLAVD